MSTLLPSFVFAELPCDLPAGFSAVPLTLEQQASASRLCVVVRVNRDGAPAPKGEQTPLIVLREMLDARVLLGALCDAGGAVHEFLELWVQDVSGLDGALQTYRESQSNATLDERWGARATAIERVNHGGRLSTGWETAHPEPMFIDVKRGVPLRAVDRAGMPWVLCEDDEFLRRKGKKGYGESLERYLYLPASGEKSGLVGVAGPEALLPFDLPRAVGLGTDAVAVNPGGGLMLVLPLAQVSFEQYVDAMSGAGQEGSPESVLRARAQQVSGASGEVSRSGASYGGMAGWFGPTSASANRRLGEVLHLKLRMLSEAVGAVRAASEAGPMLNLHAESFRVRLVEGGNGSAGLPMWWTGRVSLVMPGEAIELPIPAAQAKYFLVGTDRLSVYSPTTMRSSIQGRGVMRLRRVVDAATGSSGGSPAGESGLQFGTFFEGTLASHERLSLGPNDLIWLRMTVAGVRLDCYATSQGKPGGIAGELRIQTLAQEYPPETVARLRQAEGVPIPDVMFEVLPLLSTPFDLYSMGVLAARTLLVNQTTTLPVVLDDLLSLGGLLAGEKPPTDPSVDITTALGEMIGKALAAEPRLLEALGCHRLVSDKVDPAIAAALIPGKLWHQVLATILRTFPGMGWFSKCKDYGDAPSGAPYRVYDGLMDNLHGLLIKTRSLMVSDQALSREVQGVVRELLLRV